MGSNKFRFKTKDGKYEYNTIPFIDNTSMFVDVLSFISKNSSTLYLKHANENRLIYVDEINLLSQIVFIKEVESGRV